MGRLQRRVGSCRGGRDIEIFDNIVDSSQQGTGFRLNKVFDANIHHNTITRMGLGLTSTHPGTIMLRGDGRVHHNHIRDVWGVCSRNFGCGLNRTGKVDVYNNLFVGSRKYSAIEANSLLSDTTTRSNSPFVANADYRFYNNTIGNQQAADFTAAMVDVYTLLGGRCEIKNNLGFHIAMDKPYNPNANYVYSLQNPNPPDTARNLYRPHHADLGLEDTLQLRLLAVRSPSTRDWNWTCDRRLFRHCASQGIRHRHRSPRVRAVVTNWRPAEPPRVNLSSWCAPARDCAWNPARPCGRWGSSNPTAAPDG